MAIPRVREISATEVNPGEPASTRSPCRMSWRKSAKYMPPILHPTGQPKRLDVEYLHPMHWIRLFQRKRDADLDAEIESHLTMAIRDRLARGQSIEQARADAIREFGNVGLVKE